MRVLLLQEMARTVEDVLARRTRALLLNARAASEAAPIVASLMAEELNQDETWQTEQIEDFQQLARGYFFDSGLSPLAPPTISTRIPPNEILSLSPLVSDSCHLASPGRGT